MFTQDGGVYSFDFDFEELEADYDWRESPPLPYFAGFPCARMFTQKDNEWNKAFLEPAPELQPPPGGISVALVQYADDIVTVDFTNSSGREWLYGEAYGIDVLLDGQWHIVPPQREVAFNLPAYPLQDGETKSKDYNLEPYGALPTGTYRITFKDLAAEFVVPAVALG